MSAAPGLKSACLGSWRSLVPAVSDRPVFGRSRASRGHGPGGHAPKQERAGRSAERGLPGFSPWDFAVTFPLAPRGGIPVAGKLTVRLSPFQSKFSPSHMQGEKRCCVPGSEAGRCSGQSRRPRGPPTWRGPTGTVGGRGGGHVSAPVPRARPTEPVPSRARCAKSSRMWF